MTVRVSPRAAMVFSRAGQSDRAIKFSAQLLDSSSVPVVPPPPGMRWEVPETGGLRLGETGASGDGLTATADVHPGRSGRDTLFVRAGSHSGHAVTTNWDWADGSWSGPNWTVPGQSGCLELVGNDSGGNAVRLPEFDHTDWRSFDPGVLSADSLVVAADSLSARLCVTGRSVGLARVAVSAWDTTTLKYVGEYAHFHVLKPPLAVALEAREWELGVGQSHPVRLTLTDDLGTTVPVNPEWANSWGVSDETVLGLDFGMATARAPGSAMFRVSYLDQELVASVEVYAIVDGRFNSDVMCVLTDRGTVRCWGDRGQSLWAYGLGRSGAGRSHESGRHTAWRARRADLRGRFE